MTKETTKTINLIHLISEGAVVILYVLSIIPTFYYLHGLFWILIPLVVVNVIFSTLKKDDTINYTTVNVAMSILAFIPILGWLAIFTGIWMSMMSIQILNKQVGLVGGNEEKDSEESEVEVKTVKVTKKHKKENHEEETK